MKIGIDCRLWGESGVGRYTRNLVKELQLIDRINDYVLFVLSKDEENLKSQISNLKNKLKIKNLKLKIVKADIKWHALEEQMRLPQILNRENLDLMHFTYFSVPIFYSKPFIVTIHDLIIDHFPTGEASTLFPPLYVLKRMGYKLVISLASKRSKKIITVSNATKQEIIDHLGTDRNKIEVIYEGVDSLVQSSKPKD
ncbi:glycosyltransferase, partial [Patescibacteria group bacterium]|nr:glycosyltransferase [Patescibacteria group bacterium]